MSNSKCISHSAWNQILLLFLLSIIPFLTACHHAPDKTKTTAPAKTEVPEAQSDSSASKVDVDHAPTTSDTLPGKGLAQHDFFYAGQSEVQDMYIVRKGKIVWSYEDTTSKGEIGDATLLSNGNVLFAHQFGVTEITPDKKEVWHYDAPPDCEIQTAQAIGKTHVLFIESGEKPKLILVDITSGKTEREWPLPVKNHKKAHLQFRHARLTNAGTLLVAHMDMDKVSEYDVNGKEIWSVAVPSPWSASQLNNGNTLIASNKQFVREVNRQGQTVWQFDLTDVPIYNLTGVQIATRLPNGNTLMNNWVSNSTTDNSDSVQALEVTPDKQVVWVLRSWTAPADLGPATTIQLLDEPRAPEDVHFGNIQ